MPPFANREQIEAGQLEQLKSLLAELFPGNKFYSQKLNAAGITFDVASLDDFSKRFPFTTKQELVTDQNGYPPYGTNLTYPLERYSRYHQTSGTMGQPLRWLDTPESWESLIESWTEVWLAAEARVDDRIFFAFSFGPFIGFWLAFESAARLGCLCVPGGGLSSAARVRAIIDNGITILCCTPTYALRLAEVAAQEGIDLKKGRVRTIIVAGEPGGSIPAVRAELEQLWPGARVFDHHGMTEVGPVTFECRSQPGVLHVVESAYYAEVINPATAERMKEGQTGELVLTTLGRVASPLLRYRTGDLVKSLNSITSPCPCGRYEIRLEGGILGRVDDMIVVRGVNVYPTAVEEIVRSSGGVAEYRVVISSSAALPEMRLEIELRSDCGNPQEIVRKLESSFATALSLRVPISLAPAGSLPRSEMKAKRWTITQSPV